MNIAHPIKPLTIGRVTATSLLALALVANGCKSAPQPAPAATPATATNAPQQGTLNPDGTFTPNPTQQPAANVPPPPPATTSAPAPVAATEPPPPPAPVYRTVPAGARVAITVTQTLSASHNEVGDSFSGVLAEPLTATGGKDRLCPWHRSSWNRCSLERQGTLQGCRSSRYRTHIHRGRASLHERI